MTKDRDGWDRLWGLTLLGFITILVYGLILLLLVHAHHAQAQGLAQETVTVQPDTPWEPINELDQIRMMHALSGGDLAKYEFLVHDQHVFVRECVTLSLEEQRRRADENPDYNKPAWKRGLERDMLPWTVTADCLDQWWGVARQHLAAAVSVN